jgi:hypothetical protein
LTCKPLIQLASPTEVTTQRLVSLDGVCEICIIA